MSQPTRQGTPMSVMSEDAQRVRDRDAQIYNISAARAVSQAVRSTLGPKGMDKMIVDSQGRITITNDGSTILDKLNITNPAAAMIAEVAEAQGQEAGDGTTTAVTLAGELLKNAADLLDQEIHPTAIIHGYTMASRETLDAIENVSISIAPDDEQLLRKVAETSMTGKAAENNKEFLANLVVDALRRVGVTSDGTGPGTDLDFVRIETQSGRSVKESELIDGAVISKTLLSREMPTELNEANVLLLREPLQPEKTGIDSKIRVESPDQVQRFLETEKEQLETKIQRIIDLNVDAVLSSKGIHDVAQELLAKEGILGVRRVQKPDLAFLKDSLGVPHVFDLDSATVDDVGRADIVHDEDERLFYIRAPGERGVTLVLRGSTEYMVEEMRRSVEDALEAVSQARASEKVVPGAGAIETSASRRVRTFAGSVSGREQLAIEAFADALEVVPRVLAENAGFNSIDTLINLRTAHDRGRDRAGIDIESGGIVDAVDAGIIESAPAKKQAIISATEAANLILKIDDIISAGDLSTEGEEEEPMDEAAMMDQRGMGSMPYKDS